MTLNSVQKENESMSNLISYINEMMGEDMLEVVYDPIIQEIIVDNLKIEIQEYDGFIGEMLEGNFMFEIKNTEGEIVSGGRNDANGNILCDMFIFECNKPGTYIYYVQQVDVGSGGWTYDLTEYELKINVTGQNGKLVAEVDPTPIIFKNKYKAEPTEVTLSAAVKLYGGIELQSNQFEFNLKDDTGKVIDTAYNDATGGIVFEKMTFDSTGTHTYTISQVDRGEANIDYDDRVYTITVKIEDSGEGHLTATVDQYAFFTNTYTS